MNLDVNTNFSNLPTNFDDCGGNDESDSGNDGGYNSADDLQHNFVQHTFVDGHFNGGNSGEDNGDKDKQNSSENLETECAKNSEDVNHDDSNIIVDAESLCLEIEKKLEIGMTVENLDQARICFIVSMLEELVLVYVKGIKAIIMVQARSVAKSLNVLARVFMMANGVLLSHAKQSLVEALNSVGIGISRAYRFLEKESGGAENIGFTKKDAYNHLGKKKLQTSVANVDSSALVQLFVRKSIEEPFFYWNVQLDDDGRIMNFFFRDSHCLIDYEYFGDVLSVDTTYKTNRYDLICAPFIGINHHMKNVVFGLAFLSNETTSSFEWLFSSFLESMHGKEPQVIFSDQSQSLMNGINSTFRTARHRLCQWHVNRNAPSHFGSLNLNREFKKQWRYCMNGAETEEEFEACWRSMIYRYSLQDNRWFKSMYKLRQRWSDAFTNTVFSAGLRATLRSENTNKVIKDLCAASCSLTEFVAQYHQIVTNWRSNENVDDFANIGTPGLIASNSLILSQASKVLTRRAFKAFEEQVALAITVAIIESPKDLNNDDLEYKVASQPSMTRLRVVHFNKVSHKAQCSCHLWETAGVLCRHIFRIYMDKNVTKIPQYYFLNRWSKVAKQRHPVEYNGQCQWNGIGFADEMAFVNYAMRICLEVSHDAKKNLNKRKVILNCLMSLKKGKNLENGTGETSKGPTNAATVTGKIVRDPPLKRRVTSMGDSPKSHWTTKPQ